MLDYPITLASMLVTGIESWISKGTLDGPLHGAATPIIPNDPSTLRLLLVGVGTLVVYHALKQARSSRIEKPVDTSRLRIARAARQSNVAAEDRPKRGAA